MKIERNLLKVENLVEKRTQERIKREKRQRIFIYVFYSLLFLSIGIVW